MSTFADKMKLFTAQMEQSVYDLPPGFYHVAEEAMKAAGFDQQPIAAASAPTIKKNRKLSGYNIFMKEKSAELKKEGSL